ncbi:ArdC family protein [Burkholderia cenocepacia]|uniref:ArdC family protein n=1 Tax=Burkholderia cenocepacia TaxID=95486 RepID=UPI000846F911|nr:zincin-like metallopeptidase domain-containing protein [Burkholderia cenocepacia]
MALIKRLQTPVRPAPAGGPVPAVPPSAPAPVSAPTRKVVVLATLDAIVYVDRDSRDLVLEAKTPEALDELLKRGQSPNAVVVNDTKSSTNRHFFSNEGSIRGESVAFKLFKNFAVRLGVSDSAIRQVEALTAAPAPAAESARSPRSTRERTGERPDLFQEVTDKIVDALENGTAPWQKPWAASFEWPINGTTGKPYHGINVMLLAANEFQDGRYCTFKQAKEKDWSVRKGEHGTPIYFYKPFMRETGEIDPATQEPKMRSIPILKRYTVFNFSQIDGAPAYELKNEHERVLSPETKAICDEIIDACGVEVKHGYRISAYSPSEDRVFMPDREAFRSDAHYYASLMHEIGHWTGHSSRLNRQFGVSRDSELYAREELRAEMASAMLAMRLGLPATVENHGAYVAHYLTVLRSDKKEIFRAAKDAEKISRFVLSFHPDFRDEFREEHEAQMAAAVTAGAPEEVFDASDFDFEAEGLEFEGMKL